jgi:4,5-DOPA dioxygenase extradiol
MFPTLFVSHGSPMLALTDSPARTFLQHLGPTLGRPRAILVASAHWETRTPLASAPAHNPTIHDFRGFPAALYQLQYPAPGDPDLAARVTALLDTAGLHAATDPVRGLDHGAWVPLMLMYPDHDIPVIQLSVQPDLGPAHHLKLGHAIEKLRAENILVIGSGSFTHDLSRFRGQALDAPETPDVAAFADWFDRALTEGRTEDLLAYRRLAPHAAEEHPTEEHLLPIYVALGAAGPGAKAERLHSSTNYAILRMDAYAFH